MIRTIRRSAILALAGAALPVFALAAPASPNPSQDLNPSSRQLDFAIMRNGSQIGDYTIDIADHGGTQTVDFTTDIKVDVLMFTAYHLHHSGREIWSDGRFISYDGQTNVNGRLHTVSLAAGPRTETLVVDGQQSHPPKGAIPATLWNTKFVNATVLISPDDGKEVAVKVDDMGLDPVVVDGAPVEARRYHIGGLGDDVWMFRGSPIRFELKGSDNSTIISELKSSVTAP